MVGAEEPSSHHIALALRAWQDLFIAVNSGGIACQDLQAVATHLVDSLPLLQTVAQGTTFAANAMALPKELDQAGCCVWIVGTTLHCKCHA